MCVSRVVPPALVAVLAGGAGRRLGGAKPGTDLNGRPLISYPLSAAAAAGLEVVVVAKRHTRLPAIASDGGTSARGASNGGAFDGDAFDTGAPDGDASDRGASDLRSLDCETVHEPDLPRHPLCGIIAALHHADGRAVLAIACDMPFVTAALLGWLATLDAAAVPEVDGRPEPLLGRYVPAQLPTLERALAERRSLRETVGMLTPRVISERELRRFGDPRRLCFSVNDTDDLARAQSWLSS